MKTLIFVALVAILVIAILLKNRKPREIPTAEARTFSDSGEALRYCEQAKFPVVIKADGLALGKGVIVATDLTTAQSTIDEMMNQRRFGDAGRHIIIEEFECGSQRIYAVGDM